MRTEANKILKMKTEGNIFLKVKIEMILIFKRRTKGEMIIVKVLERRARMTLGALA